MTARTAFGLLATLLFVAACATVEGAGEDIAAAGDAVSDAARTASQ
ncbi:MAG: entericidin A/B family lipoprotein [Pseudomonadota bacterium]